MRVEPLAERHRDGLREAAEREPQIHRFTGMYSLGFNRWFDEAVGSATEVPFAVIVDGKPVGSTRYLNIEPFHHRTEIVDPPERAHWGTGANIETKYLLPKCLRRLGAMRVEFKTDARNLRVRRPPRHRRDLRGHLSQAHGAAGLHPRLGLVRDRRRRLARREGSAREEDRAARPLMGD